MELASAAPTQGVGPPSNSQVQERSLHGLQLGLRQHQSSEQGQWLGQAVQRPKSRVRLSKTPAKQSTIGRQGPRTKQGSSASNPQHTWPGNTPQDPTEGSSTYQQTEIQQSEAQQPDTQQPETRQPDTQQPDTQQPETQQPETRQPAASEKKVPKLLTTFNIFIGIVTLVVAIAGTVIGISSARVSQRQALWRDCVDEQVNPPQAIQGATC